VNYPAGATIVHQGDRGDAYFVIAEGTAEVSVDGTWIRNMARGQGFGEIALLADVERTATVVATTAICVLVLDRAQFLDVVGGHAASERLAWKVARALHAPLADDGV